MCHVPSNTLIQGCTTQNWCWVNLIGTYDGRTHIKLNENFSILFFIVQTYKMSNIHYLKSHIL